MHDDFTSLGIRQLLQSIQACLAQSILRISLVIGPGQNYFTRTDKGTDIIYMLVCFIVINTARNPQNLFHAQVSLKLLLNLLFGKVRIASCAQKAGFCYQCRTLAVAVNRTALQHKGNSIIHRSTIMLRKLFRKSIVLLIIGIQAVYLAAPGIKAPVHATQLASLFAVAHNKSRADVTRPAVVRFHSNQLNIGHTCKIFLRHSKVLSTADNITLFARRNRLNHSRKRFAGRHCAKAPRARTLRPHDNTAIMRFVFAGHVKAVGSGSKVFL